MSEEAPGLRGAGDRAAGAVMEQCRTVAFTLQCSSHFSASDTVTTTWHGMCLPQGLHSGQAQTGWADGTSQLSSVLSVH